LFSAGAMPPAFATLPAPTGADVIVSQTERW
jgi:hypothetical protein